MGYFEQYIVPFMLIVYSLGYFAMSALSAGSYNSTRTVIKGTKLLNVFFSMLFAFILFGFYLFDLITFNNSLGKLFLITLMIYHIIRAGWYFLEKEGVYLRSYVECIFDMFITFFIAAGVWIFLL